jgi:uncharacterized FlaG/YvyC family protein
MASDGIPVNRSVTRLVQGSRARTSEPVSSGKTLPAGGGAAPTAATEHVVHPTHVTHTAQKPDASALVAQLNEHLNNSGRAAQFRLNSSSGREVIQQINPDTGEVIAELPAAEFPKLAQGLSGAGLLIDTKA